MNGVFAEECGGLLPARGLQCHRSQLIYPLPLSSCYAWSLNLPFLLFFPCYSSQIPLSDFSLSPHSALIFIFYPLILSEHDTCSINMTGFTQVLENMSRQPREPQCDVQWTPENTSEDTCVSTVELNKWMCGEICPRQLQVLQELCLCFSEA